MDGLHELVPLTHHEGTGENRSEASLVLTMNWDQSILKSALLSSTNLGPGFSQKEPAVTTGVQGKTQGGVRTGERVSETKTFTSGSYKAHSPTLPRGSANGTHSPCPLTSTAG